MPSIKLRSKVNSEGQLMVQVPENLANQELDIIIVYQPVLSEPTPEELDYPPDFFAQTAGAWKGEPL